MATRENFNLTLFERRRRTFSEDFKRKKVQDLSQGLITVSQLSRDYQVTRSMIYRWIESYGGKSGEKSVRLVVEMESDSIKLKQLQIKIANLERQIGQKQVLLEFQQKMLEMVEEEFGADYKKKLLKKLSSGSGEIEKD